MTAAAHGRPIRFFGTLIVGWIAIRLASADFRPSISGAALPQAPSILPAPQSHASPLPTQHLLASVGTSVHQPRQFLLAQTHGPLSWSIPAIVAENGITVDRTTVLRFTTDLADRHYADTDSPQNPPAPLAGPLLLPPPTPTDRWRGAAWLLWRPGDSTAVDLATVGRLGGSQAGARLDYDLTPASTVRTAAYGRITGAIEQPHAPEAAIGLSLQPTRLVPVSLAVERRIALGTGARNANAVMLVGGFGPRPVVGAVEASGYAQTGMVGFHAHDLFIDGKLSLLAPIAPGPLRVGGSLSGGAQPQVERLDIGPEVQLRLPLPRMSARLGVEWRERIAGHAAPASGLAVTLATDF